MLLVSNAASQDVVDRYDLRIEEDTLGRALAAIVEQTDAQLLYPYDMADAAGVNPVVGQYTIEEALAVLLRGTEFSGGLTPRGVIVISREQEIRLQEGESEVADRGLRRSLLASVAAVMFGQTAVAQDGETGSGSAARDDVIVVTATRREQNLQDVPLAITALDGEEMASQGIENYEDFARNVAGLNIVQGGQQFSRFTIRGMQTTTATSSNGEQKLAAVYIDEVPISSFSVVTPNLRLVDIERVEVLRGPQGTLYGSGSLSGAVRVITNKPMLGEHDVRGSVDLGVRDGEMRQRYTGVVNMPIADNAAVRAVGYYRDEPGYLDNQDPQIGRENFNGSEEWGGRLALRVQPTDRLMTTFMVMHDEVESGGYNLFNPDLGLHQASLAFDNTAEVEFTNYNATIEYDLDWATLTSSTTYSESLHDWEFDSGLTPLGVATIAGVYSEVSDQKAIVEEVRLVSSGDSALQWLAGAFYMNRDTDWNGVIGYRNESPDDPNIDGVADFNITGLPMTISEGVEPFASFADRNFREQAVFGELSYRLTDELTAAVGLRYSGTRFVDTITTEGYSAFTPFFTAFFIGGGNINVDDYRRTENSIIGSEDLEYTLTKRFSLTWEPTDDQTFYGVIADGFRREHPNTGGFVNGGVSITDPTNPVIIPQLARSDSLWNYEIGMKSDWLDGRLRSNVAVYFIPWEDMQIGLARPGDGTVFTGNVGKAELRGVEAEFWALPTDETEMGLSVTLQSGEVTELNAEDALLSGAVEGAKLAAPEFQIAGYVQRNWSLGNGQDVFARVDAQHVGSYPNGFPNALATGLPSPNFTDVESYENVNVSVGWQNDNWNLTLYGQNVFENEDYIYISPASVPQSHATLPPRTIGVRASWRR
ncbi:MAG: TonB-dependent receptor [Maricaulaceae bacterium]